MDDNWIVENLENALATWNEKLAEVWQLVSMTPQEFKGGGIWNIVVQINGALQAIGYGLLVLFFAMGLFKNTVNFQELRRPEAALRYFLHFVAAKAAVTYCMPLMLAVFDICGGIVSTVAGQMGGMAGNVGTLPGEISAAIGNVGFLASIPLWLVTILGSLFITVLSFILIMTVYGNFFKEYSGFGGYDAMLAGMLTEGVHKRGLPLERLAALTSGNPARVMGLAPRKGSLLPGTDADIAVVDLDAEWVFDGTKSLSKTKSSHNIYHGSHLKGKVEQTWVRGELIYDHGTIKAARGYGRFVAKQK